MPSAPEKLAASPGRMVTLMALKCSGTATTVGILVAATTARVIADGAGVVCAVAGTERDAALSSTTAKVLKSMVTSRDDVFRCRVTQRHPLKSRSARHEHPTPSLW